jgi:hypothetical protein
MTTPFFENWQAIEENFFLIKFFFTFLAVSFEELVINMDNSSLLSFI